MASSPLPLLLLGGAALFLMSRGSDDEDEGTSKPDDEKQDSDDTPEEEKEKEKEIEDQDKKDEDEEAPPPPPDMSPSGYSNVTRDEMRVIQSRLHALGYYNDDIDGLYGPNTRSATSAFQKAYGLQVDGKPGPNTQDALALAVAGQLEPKSPSGTGTGSSSGMSGYSNVTRDEMKVIQSQLTQLEYYSDAPEDNDGLYGPMTKAATAAFQKCYGLDVDGKPGSNTQDALIRAVAGEIEKIPDGSFVEEEEDVDVNKVFDPEIEPDAKYVPGTIRSLTLPKYDNDWQPKAMVVQLSATGRWEWRSWVDYKTGEKSMTARGTSDSESSAISLAKAAVDDWADRNPRWRAKLNRTIAGSSYEETQEPGNPGVDYWEYTGQMTYDNRWAWAVRKMDVTGTPMVMKGWQGTADTLQEAIDRIVTVTQQDMSSGSRETQDSTRLDGVVYTDTYKREVKDAAGVSGYQFVSEYAEKVPGVDGNGDVIPGTTGWSWIVRLGVGMYPAWLPRSGKTLKGTASSKFAAQTKIDESIALITEGLDAPAPTPPATRETTRLTCDGSPVTVVNGEGGQNEIISDDPESILGTYIYDFSYGKRASDGVWQWRVVEYLLSFGLYRSRQSCSVGEAVTEAAAKSQIETNIEASIDLLPNS